jgi:hypothetical protein
LVDFLGEKDLTVEQALVGIDQPFHLTDGGRVHPIAAPMNDSSLSLLFQQVKVGRTSESFGVLSPRVEDPMSDLDSLSKNPDPRLFKKVQMQGAREIDERRRIY